MSNKIGDTEFCIGDIVRMKNTDSDRVMKIKSILFSISSTKFVVSLDIYEYRDGIFINTIRDPVLDTARNTDMLIKDVSMTRKFKIYSSMNEI
jgi:hypothetical protein